MRNERLRPPEAASRAPAGLQIEPAGPEDVPLLAQLIRELAAFVHMEAGVTMQEAGLRRDLFGPRPYAEAFIARDGAEALGFVLFHHTYSTFQGRPGVYLEDLYVRAGHRRRGVGTALVARLASLARERGCSRIDSQVLTWNQAALGFCAALGAATRPDWEVYRLAGPSLDRLAWTP
jgi:GNAT superfamily N-acetyltransferase